MVFVSAEVGFTSKVTSALLHSSTLLSTSFSTASMVLGLARLGVPAERGLKGAYIHQSCLGQLDLPPPKYTEVILLIFDFDSNEWSSVFRQSVIPS